MSVCTRFAPSPTGHLHIGGVRTALFSWLYAKKMAGEFILRIEDTDRERSTEASVNAILEGMDWLQLDYQQGPYYQTARFDRYKELIQQLLDEGKAYRCYCSKERLEDLRASQMAAKQKPKYDGHCRNLNNNDLDKPHVIRFRNPEEGAVQFEDAVYGMITVSNSELDDLIIARGDGTPTYNFTVVIDDMDMKISHVIRGDDHINNTPRQINIFKALDKPIPTYAHVPMILGPDQKRLSKRHGAVSVLQYREDGILPQAVINYLVRLGWSHGDQEIFSVDEMVAFFDIKDVNRAASSLNPDKLLWLNQHYLKTLPVEEIKKELAWHFEQQGGVDVTQGPSLEDLIALQRERVKTVKEMVQHSLWLYQDVTSYDEKAVKHLKEAALPVLSLVKERIDSVAEWELEAVSAVIKGVVTELELKFPKVAQPVRVALTGNTISPSIDETIMLLGREKTSTRLAKAIAHIG